MIKITPIEITAYQVFEDSHIYNNLRHVFNALRENKELLEQPDYKRLYDEVIDYLYRYSVREIGLKSGREKLYDILELYSDLENASPIIEGRKFSVDTLNTFLSARRLSWSLE